MTTTHASFGAPLSSAASFTAIAPPGDLEPFVEYLWQFTVRTSTSLPAKIRLVPGGQLDVTLGHLEMGFARTGELIDSGPRLCAVMDSSHAVPVATRSSVIGVRLRLGAGSRVLRTALASVSHARPSLQEMLGGRRAGAVRTAITSALRGLYGPTPVRDGLAAALAATRRLVSFADFTRAVDPRVRQAVVLLDRAVTGPRSGTGSAVVHEIARAVATTPRTLERLFRDHVGLAPRTFLRLRRVCLVAARLEAPVTFLSTGPERPTLSHLAHHAGFADHAHLTRDFGRTMGVTPSEYAREARERPIARDWRSVRPELITPIGTIVDSLGDAEAGQAA